MQGILRAWFVPTRYERSFRTPSDFRLEPVIPKHHGPWPNLPLGHEPISDIRIVADELFDRGTIRNAKYQERPISRVRQGAGLEKFAALVCCTNEPKVLLPVHGPARYEVIDYIVKKCEVFHVASSQIRLNEAHH
jgi:hypothetical protein